MNRRLQLLYQKTDFNRSRICQLPSVFKCCKCKKNNTILTTSAQMQFCLFCGMPNLIQK